MTDIITDDITAWNLLPKSRWMLNKLYVHQKMGADCGPIGIEPTKFPVWVKPVINVHGLGIKSRLVYDSNDLEYEPGMMWMPYYSGVHMSYDILYNFNEIIEVYAAEGVGGPYFNKWVVTKIEPTNKLRYLINRLSVCGELPERFNIETIGDKLIECHPRWSEEFCLFYDENAFRPFTQHVMWDKDVNAEVPETWIDCRNDPCNQWTGELKRIAYKYEEN